MNDAGLATATYWAPLLETIADIAFAIVIVALAVELVAGRIAKRFEREIDAARELKIAELNNETSQLRALAGPREIYLESFRKEMEDKPKAHIQIWYLESEDARWYVNRLYAALSISGWEVDMPVPIPPLPDSVDSRLREMSLRISKASMAGGQPFGTTLVGGNPDDEPTKALRDALRKTSTEQLLYGSSGSQFMPVPKGTVRIVVGEKTGPMAPASVPPR